MPMGFGLWKIEHPGHASAVFAMRNPGVQLRQLSGPAVQARIANVDLALQLADAATAPAEMVLVQLGPICRSPSSRRMSRSIFRRSTSTASRSRTGSSRSSSTPAVTRVRNSGAICRSATAATDWRAAVATVRRRDRAPGTGDLGGRHVPRRHGRSPGRRRELVRGRRLRAVSRQGAADRVPLVPRRHVAERAARIARVRRSSARATSPGKGTAPVGRHAGIGPYGTYDMAGNVREWLWNAVAARTLDRGWRVEPAALPLHRARRGAALGPLARQRHPLHAHAARARVRRGTARADRAEVGRLRGARAGRGRRLRGARAAARILAGGPGRAQSSRFDSTNPLWTRERITLATGYDDSRFAVQLFLPTERHAALPAGRLRTACGVHERPFESNDFDPTESAQPLDFILKSGRALVVVALDGTFERHWSPERTASR